MAIYRALWLWQDDGEWNTATSERGPMAVFAGRYVPPSLHLVCRGCGDTMLRVEVTDPSTGKPSPWGAETAICHHCPPGIMSDVPGSIWRDWDQAFNAAIPPKLLTHECRLHFQAYDKENQ